ncbi:hypothetical protein Nepgr_015810 [Nepenthes gracilis]|uniref:Uncharacterized protein n=1 Tax=Nepenthes gracilis TaxID=150966 RepID=A0AAD3SNF7_NEPGR|nr:hypothetical protein Nepgr_015810 [Nepenthes gracilis]
MLDPWRVMPQVPQPDQRSCEQCSRSPHTGPQSDDVSSSPTAVSVSAQLFSSNVQSNQAPSVANGPGDGFGKPSGDVSHLSLSQSPVYRVEAPLPGLMSSRWKEMGIDCLSGFWVEKSGKSRGVIVQDFNLWPRRVEKLGKYRDAIERYSSL